MVDRLVQMKEDNDGSLNPTAYWSLKSCISKSRRPEDGKRAGV